MQLFGGLEGRLEKLEAENAHLLNLTNILFKRLSDLEKVMDGQVVTAAVPVASAKPPVKAAAAKPVDDESSDDDNDVLTFDDDSKPKDNSLAKKQAQQANQNKPKEEKKPKNVVIQKSNLILDVKPYSNETDVEEMEKLVRKITMKGLTWGDSKFIDVAYGVKKLRISTVLIDDEVCTEDIENAIMDIPDPEDPKEGIVQSVDTHSLTKV
jgi:translation elongation factor EF-1beta